MSATTAYQNKSVVGAPIPAFITEVLVQPGSRVKAGDILYRIESKEQHALGSGNRTAIPIQAERDGIVLDVQQQAGSYITEGAVLCSVAEAGSLVFEINVPYEQRRYAYSGSKCMLELPDGTRLTATVHAPLATMNTVSQSERVIARAKTPFLPEGMNVKAVFTESGSSSDKGMILPKSAVQSDETLTEHWVMKLADDSTAVKVPVEVGNSNASEIEIKSAALLPQDCIILTGGYGLEDGAKVIVTKEEAAL
uniref:efflux RND transporter periplasmic adaptor subunit n=1 Tax=Phocaeicola dorei TaxID=357276 RepID=UPI004028CF2F